MPIYLSELIPKTLQSSKKFFFNVIPAILFITLLFSADTPAAETVKNSSDTINITGFLIAGAILFVAIVGYAILVQKTEIGCKNCVCSALGRKPCDEELQEAAEADQAL
jgi:hypothetical protein